MISALHDVFLGTAAWVTVAVVVWMLARLERPYTGGDE